MSAHDDPNARMCYRKKAMPEHYARKVAARAHGLRAYQCPICSLWHVTNDFDDEGRPKGPLSQRSRAQDDQSHEKGNHHAEDPECQ